MAVFGHGCGTILLRPQYRAVSCHLPRFFSFKTPSFSSGGIALCLSQLGRRSGEAMVRFEDRAHRDMALKRHRHYMGARYLEIYKATAADFMAVTTSKWRNVISA